MNSSLPGWHSQRRRTLAATVSVPELDCWTLASLVDAKNASTANHFAFSWFVWKQKERQTLTG